MKLETTPNGYAKIQDQHTQGATRHIRRNAAVLKASRSNSIKPRPLKQSARSFPKCCRSSSTQPRSVPWCGYPHTHTEQPRFRFSFSCHLKIITPRSLSTYSNPIPLIYFRLFAVFCSFLRASLFATRQGAIAHDTPSWRPKYLHHRKTN